MKQHRDFVTYIRNSVAINALVAFSHDIYTPATQTEPAKTVEHLTLVYLDPAAASNSIPTGDQLRNSIKTEFSVAPLADGLVNGWKDAVSEGNEVAFQSSIQWREYAAALEKSVIADGHPNLQRIASNESNTEYPSDASIEATFLKSSGIDGDAGYWTHAGQTEEGFPVPKGSAEDITKSEPIVTQGFQKVADAAAALHDEAEPVIETKEYADGTTATGVAPLPDQSPAEQEASKTTE